MKEINGKMFKQMVLSGAIVLHNNHPEVDALNVFPVPDGDTGTNMSLTFNSGAEQVEKLADDTSIGDIAKTLSKGLLMGARGNSGVILSQIFRGVAKSLKGKETANVAELSDAFSSGAKVAYKAVMRPVEGTILTVIRESADAAAKYVQPDMEIEDWFSYFVKSAEKSLDNTPELLPVLKEVGVVDSGGAGLLLVLTGFMAALAGEVIEKVDNVGAASDVEIVQEEEKPYGYRVQFTLKIDDRKMNAFNLDGFINELKNLPGKNVDVAQKDNKVIGNVDTLKPGNALNTGLRFGEFTKVTVVNTEVSEEEKEAFKEKTDSLVEIFRKALGNDKLEVKVEKMKDENVASMITLSEESRRMQEMMKMYGMSGMDPSMFGANGQTLVLNANNDLVKYIVDHKDGENTPVFCEQLYDLALLSHAPLTPEQMTNFIARSNKIMELLAK